MKNIKLSKNIIVVFILLSFILLYSNNIKELIITTTQVSKNYKIISLLLYGREVYKVIDKNKVVESDLISDSSLIDFKKNIFDKEIKRDKNSIYKKINIKGNGYNGYIIFVFDSSKIKLELSKDYGIVGEDALSLSKRVGAKVVVNASSFLDLDWNSNGSIAHGMVVKDGKIISNEDKFFNYGGMIGFDYNNKLILGKMNKDDIKKYNIRDGIEFGPFLIVNGKKNEVLGNGGFGISQRTAIGQRRDGTVLFVVINGRVPTSIGATMNDLIDIFSFYNCINAANLDGGSSTSLVINNKVINNITTYKLRKIPTFWIVK